MNFEKLTATLEKHISEKRKLKKALTNLIEDIETPSRLGLDKPVNKDWLSLWDAKQLLKELSS